MESRVQNASSLPRAGKTQCFKRGVKIGVLRDGCNKNILDQPKLNRGSSGGGEDLRSGSGGGGEIEQPPCQAKALVLNPRWHEQTGGFRAQIKFLQKEAKRKS